MNERYEALFASNRDIFDGARVLDLASHDGRYSFAALKTGAAHVTGVEVRKSLIEKAQETFAFYGQNPATYRFICGDVFEVLEREKLEVDVVLCLGYLYRTYRYTELMYRLHQLAPRHLIVDTMVVPGTKPTLRVDSRTRLRGHPSGPPRMRTRWIGCLVGRPSVPALQMMLRAYGFEIESMYDWKGRLAGGRCPVSRATRRASARPCDAAPAPSPRPRAGSRSLLSSPAPSSPRPAGVNGPRHRPPQPAAGWRGRVNQALTKATGFELRRASGKR